jgi:hypothetical protein
MFQSELSTAEENGQRPLMTKPPSAFRPRPAASAIDEAISASGFASHTSCWVAGRSIRGKRYTAVHRRVEYPH